MVIRVTRRVCNRKIAKMWINKIFYLKVKSNLGIVNKTINLAERFFTFGLKKEKSYHGRSPILCYD